MFGASSELACLMEFGISIHGPFEVENTYVVFGRAASPRTPLGNLQRSPDSRRFEGPLRSKEKELKAEGKQQRKGKEKKER